jgi:serine/threonine protein kinase/Tfp pilus assembly protein PilF
VHATLSHYRVLEEIGSGGMGVVYRARDEHLDCDVAIKVLPAGKLTDPGARKRFRNEALALSKINHPNIAVVHDFDTQDGIDFLIQELIPGASLREMLKAGALSQYEIIRLGLQLCDGLAAAHEQGVVHRDLKPENIRVTPRAQLKILDFGLARVTDSAPLASLTACETQTLTSLAGTLPYMAPEQVLGVPVDGRADIWAVGVVLYEMATGRRPFAGDAGALVKAIMNDEPASPFQADGGGAAALSAIILKCLEKDLAKRYQHAQEIAADLQLLSRAPAELARRSRGRRWIAVSLTGVLAVGAGAAWLVAGRHRQLPLREGDSIVLADFHNSTGDPIFDDALQQGLALQLAQSPLFDVISDRQTANTLRMMGRAATDRIAGETAREVCLRTNSTVLIEGSIANLGSSYVLGVRATSCATGHLVQQDQRQVERKEEVLDALGTMATGLRTRLGESLGSIQKLDVPLAEATTPSLEALQSFSVGMKHVGRLQFDASIPYFEHAIALDPQFALAYARLASSYDNVGDQKRSSANAGKAFELRNKVTEPERLYIEGRYYLTGSYELDKAAQVYELWKGTYPRAAIPYNNLGVIHRILGQYEQAIPEAEEYARRVPNVFAYSNLISDYLYADRVVEAQAALDDARRRKLNMDDLAPFAYKVAFARGDEAEMRRLLATAGNSPDNAATLLDMDALTQVYHGRLESGIKTDARAAEVAVHAGQTDADLAEKVQVALWQVELRGGDARLRRQLRQWLKDPRILENERIAMLALARAGDAAHARAAAEALPPRPLLRVYWKPTILAAAALQANKPAEALRLLEPVAPYELCAGGATEAGPYAIYLRGEAYLRLGQGAAAAAAFQKVLRHRGITLYSHLAPLAHVALARTYTLQGNPAKARAEYEAFFALWKDADATLPLLRKARSEYAELH